VKWFQEWAWGYILGCENLPLNIYSTWNTSVLEDEDFMQKLLLHLQGIGKYIRANIFITTLPLGMCLVCTAFALIVSGSSSMKSIGNHTT
jgi:hypothetical protein